MLFRYRTKRIIRRSGALEISKGFIIVESILASGRIKGEG